MIRHVLLDADGVVQRSAGFDDELAVLTSHLGESTTDFLTRTFPSDGPVLCGQADVVPLLAAALLESGSEADAAELYADLWLAIEVLPETLAIARELREAGLGVHLATNQDAGRAAYMKAELGYSDAFDTCFYSSDLGCAKPSAAFFERCVAELAAPAVDVLFIDDSPANVDGAHAAGLRAERWESTDGLPELRKYLARHGVAVSD